MEKLLTNLLLPLLTRLGTFVGGAVLALGATSQQAQDFTAALTAMVLILCDLGVRKIVNRK